MFQRAFEANKCSNESIVLGVGGPRFQCPEQSIKTKFRSLLARRQLIWREQSQAIPFQQHRYSDLSPTVFTAITRYRCRSPATAVPSLNCILANGWVGVSLYWGFWKTGRPKGFFPFSGTVAITLPSRSMMKWASPLSRSATASQISSLPRDPQVRRRGRRGGVHHRRVPDILRPCPGNGSIGKPDGVLLRPLELRRRNRNHTLAQSFRNDFPRDSPQIARIPRITTTISPDWNR